MINDNLTLGSNKIPIKNIYNYSTDEQVVGVWLDGKLIYNKIFTGNLSGKGHVRTIISGITNCNLLPMTSFIIGSSFSGYDGSCGYRIEKSGDNLLFLTSVFNAWAGATFILSMYYTKTE